MSLQKKIVLISRFRKIFFALDNDTHKKVNAGQEAAMKFGPELASEIETWNILLPSGKDPDDCTKDEFVDAVNHAKRF
jgi:DNA primase